MRNVRSALLCSPKISGESWPGRRSIAERKSSTVLQSGTSYPGNSVLSFSSTPWLKYLLAYVSISNSSKPSVMRPPYWMLLTMYVTVGQVGDASFLASISVRWFCKNCTHALRSDWLNSYGTFQPMGPNLRLSCTMECM